MIVALVLLGHLAVCGTLLAFVVYPWSEKYDYYVVQGAGASIDAAGLLWRYAYASILAWACTGLLPFFLIERTHAGAPVRSRVAWSVVVGFLLLAAAAIGLGTNLFFPNRIARPAFVQWMDPFLAEFHFISFMGYGVLVAVASIATHYLLRRS